MILIAILILYSCDLCVKISKFSLYSHIVPQTFDKRKYLISILFFIPHGIWFFHSTAHIGRTIHAFYSVKTTKLELGDSPQFYCHASTSLDNIDIVKWSPKKKYLNYASIINEDRAKREILSFLTMNLTRKKL